MAMASVDELKERIVQLEAELARQRGESSGNNAGGRTKIDQMSAEVVDSNPYR